MNDDEKDFLDVQLENVAASEPEADREQPTPEQLLLKVAIESLTSKQREIWEMYAYDQMTQEEIAAKLKISQQGVQKKLRDIDNKIQKYCEQNKAAYLLMKIEQKVNEDA